MRFLPGWMDMAPCSCEDVFLLQIQVFLMQNYVYFFSFATKCEIQCCMQTMDRLWEQSFVESIIPHSGCHELLY